MRSRTWPWVQPWAGGWPERRRAPVWWVVEACHPHSNPLPTWGTGSLKAAAARSWKIHPPSPPRGEGEGEGRPSGSGVEMVANDATVNGPPAWVRGHRELPRRRTARSSPRSRLPVMEANHPHPNPGPPCYSGAPFQGEGAMGGPTRAKGGGGIGSCRGGARRDRLHARGRVRWRLTTLTPTLSLSRRGGRFDTGESGRASPAGERAGVRGHRGRPRRCMPRSSARSRHPPMEVYHPHPDLSLKGRRAT